MGTANKRSNAKSSIAVLALGCFVCGMFGIIGPWFLGLIAPDGSLDTGTVETEIVLPKSDGSNPVVEATSAPTHAPTSAPTAVPTDPGEVSLDLDF